MDSGNHFIMYKLSRIIHVSVYPPQHLLCKMCTLTTWRSELGVVICLRLNKDILIVVSVTGTMTAHSISNRANHNKTELPTATAGTTTFCVYLCIYYFILSMENKNFSSMHAQFLCTHLITAGKMCTISCSGCMRSPTAAIGQI